MADCPENSINWLPIVITAVVSFLSGWGTSELTNWTRRTTERRELRRGLISELENGEVLASITVAKYARFFQGPGKSKQAADEIRWFLKHGRKRMHAAGVLENLPAIPKELDTLSDEQIVALFSAIKETQGPKLSFPVVDGVLAGKTAGLSAQQIAALSMVHWNAYLLSQDADAVKDFLHMTFTVTNNNHPRILENHDMRCASYALRAEVLVRSIRRALDLLQK